MHLLYLCAQYSPEHLEEMPNYPEVTYKNPYLMARRDQSIVDAQEYTTEVRNAKLWQVSSCGRCPVVAGVQLWQVVLNSGCWHVLTVDKMLVLIVQIFQICHITLIWLMTGLACHITLIWLMTGLHCGLS